MHSVFVHSAIASQSFFCSYGFSTQEGQKKRKSMDIIVCEEEEVEERKYKQENMSIGRGICR